MKYTQIPSDTFQKLQMNAGILAKGFDPATGEVSGIMGATTGGVNFTATPNYIDLGDDVDNCPKNTKELKILDSVDVAMSGTFISVDSNVIKDLIAAGDVDVSDSTHVVPRSDLSQSDFNDVWWIGDYSNVNTGASAGFIAIRLMNALNTAGFQIQSTDKAKGQFAFTFTGHYSISAQDVVPYEVYISGGSGSTPYVLLDVHSKTLEVNEKFTLDYIVVPEGATVTWASANTTIATVSNGEVTAKVAGNTIITASITIDGNTYTDTCTIIVTGE